MKQDHVINQDLVNELLHSRYSSEIGKILRLELGAESIGEILLLFGEILLLVGEILLLFGEILLLVGEILLLRWGFKLA